MVYHSVLNSFSYQSCCIFIVISLSFSIFRQIQFYSNCIFILWPSQVSTIIAKWKYNCIYSLPLLNGTWSIKAGNYLYMHNGCVKLTRLMFMILSVLLKASFSISSDIISCSFSFLLLFLLLTSLPFNITELIHPEGYEYRKGEHSSPKSIVI